MYRHTAYLVALAFLAGSLCLAFAAGGKSQASSARRDEEVAALAGALQLTDLALWTEASYTRNPALTDFFTPFQDVPGGPEHFPAGAIIAPPPQLSGESREEAL